MPRRKLPGQDSRQNALRFCPGGTVRICCKRNSPHRATENPIARAAQKREVTRNSGYGLPGFDFAVELATRTLAFLKVRPREADRVLVSIRSRRLSSAVEHSFRKAGVLGSNPRGGFREIPSRHRLKGYSICRAVLPAISWPSNRPTMCRLMSIPAAIPAEQMTLPLSMKRRSAWMVVFGAVC